MVPGQDWCLECGTAAPGRLGRRPGVRTAATVVGLTLALVAGAVTAGYAAINGDAGRDVAAAPAPSAAPIAQAPPSTPAAPTPTPTAHATPVTPLPKVAPPKASTPPPAATPTPAPSTPSTPKPAASTPTTTKPAPVDNALTAIDLGADAASLYDPYTRMVDNGDPANAYDGDMSTAWKVSTPPDGQAMQVGLVVDLSKKRSIKELQLRTSTPGFRVELYAADTAQLPPDILDTRWAHLRNHSDVAKKQKVSLAGDGHKYRYVLIWFTTPPKAGPSVKINELKLLG